MVIINSKRQFCYRICHIQNISYIMKVGLCTKHHPDADPDFKTIGNPEIIDTRDDLQVKFAHFGNIGEYVPFYFTPRSLMLYNIVTGFRAPLVPKLPKEQILVIRCLISDLAKLNRFFFTDGQANTAITKHYTDLDYLGEIDWDSIQKSNFSKSEDFDRPRRYQAEFLVHGHVPVSSIQSLHVYNEKAAQYVKNELDKLGIINLQVHITPDYFFN